VPQIKEVPQMRLKLLGAFSLLFIMTSLSFTQAPPVVTKILIKKSLPDPKTGNYHASGDYFIAPDEVFDKWVATITPFDPKTGKLDH
jgi:hypothetical protein